MELYHYKYKKLDYILKEVEQKNVYIREYRLIYSSPYPTGIEVNDRVNVRLFFNKNKSKKNTTYFKNNHILILIHGFSSKNKSMDNYYRFIDKMNENNLSCAFMNLPFHLNRTPDGEKSGERLLYFDDMETLQFFHQCVVDVKKLISILTKILTFKKIYICGISLGSMVSLITMANDNRINKGVFVIGGGNWEEIHWKGILRFALKGNCVYGEKKYKNKTNREACGEIYSTFPIFLKKIKEIKPNKIRMDLKDLPDLKRVTTKMCFLCDPLAFAYRIKPEKVLMINSKFDFYFPKDSTEQLWEELGKPKILWLNKMHSSKILTDKKIIKEITNFL